RIFSIFSPITSEKYPAIYDGNILQLSRSSGSESHKFYETLYEKYLTPDGLKDVHTISSFHLFKAAIKKRGGTDNMYLDFQEYFERWCCKGKWVCLITDPVIVKNMLLRPDTYPKLDLKEYSPVYSRHFGANVIHQMVIFGRDIGIRVCNPAFKTLPIHLFAETGIKLINILERIDNKPIEVIDLMQRFTLDALGKTVFDLILM
ncbi:577_t:CDS:2, partial [Dentiscutata heterogama]